MTHNKEFHEEYHQDFHEGKWASKTLIKALMNTPTCVCCGDKTKLFKVLYRYRCVDCHTEQHLEYTNHSLEDETPDPWGKR